MGASCVSSALLLVSYLTCLVFIEAQISTLDLYEGEVCKDVEALWTCKHVKDCPKAQDNLKKGTRPEICSFEGKNPIICCQSEEDMLLPGGTKAKQMCKKSSEAVFVSTPDPVNASVFIKTDTCSFTQNSFTKGYYADPREFPHTALIGFGPKDSITWACGGSLISERYVLCAAHCSNSIKGPARWVRLGDYDIMSTEDDEHGEARPEEFEIIERINYPSYQKPGLDFDIALYKLDRDVVFNEFIRPICLQSDPQDTTTSATATSWGHPVSNVGGKQTDVLHEIKLDIVESKRCNDEYAETIENARLKDGIQDQTQLCVSYDSLRAYDCQIDIGGPLQVRMEEPYCTYALIGISSFGPVCRRDKLAVYTRVSYFLPWIESIVWP